MQDVLFLLVLLLGAAGVGWYFVGYKMPKEKAQKRASAMRRAIHRRKVQLAENKVKVSDPITRRDIELLENAGSIYANDAQALRRRQVDTGRAPD